MDHHAMARLVQLAQEANAAGDWERVSRVLDTLFNAHWHALAGEVTGATACAMAAVEAGRAPLARGSQRA